MPTALKAKAKKRTSVSPSTKAKRPAVQTNRMLGKVIHYYDNIHVAIVEVSSTFRLGELVLVRHGVFQFVQPITSLQIEHVSVSKVKRGDIVGMHVMHKISEGATVEAV